MGFLLIERRGNGNVVLVAGDGVPHQDLAGLRKEDEEETMATSKGHGAVEVVVTLQGEAPARNTIGGLQSRCEGQIVISVEETEEGRVAAVAEAETAGEAGVGDEAAPALADCGCAGERGGMRREAKEDLAEEVVVVQRPGRRRPDVAAAAAAGHLTLELARVGWGVKWSDTETVRELYPVLTVREPRAHGSIPGIFMNTKKIYKLEVTCFRLLPLFIKSYSVLYPVF
jgi:hypothetical protein